MENAILIFNAAIDVLDETFMDAGGIHGRRNGPDLWDLTFSWNQPTQDRNGFFEKSQVTVKCDTGLDKVCLFKSMLDMMIGFQKQQ